MIRSWLRFACLFVSASAVAPAQEGGFTRVHDVGRLLMAFDEVRPPAFGLHRGRLPTFDPTTQWERTEAECLELVRKLAGVDMGPDGQSGHLAGPGQIEVHCRDADHRAIDRLLEQLGDLSMATATISVHVLPGKVLSGRSPRLTAAQLAELLRASPPLASHRAVVPFGAWTTLGSHGVRPWVAGYGAQLAESVAIVDPLSGDSCLGREWALQVAPTSDGRFLVQLDGGDAADGEKRVLSVATAMRSEAAKESPVVQLELPEVVLGSLVASGVLRAGEALLVGADQGADTALCLVVDSAPRSEAGAIDGVHVLPIGELLGSWVGGGGGRVLRGGDGRWAGFEPARGSFVDREWLRQWLREQSSARGVAASFGELPTQLLLRSSPEVADAVRRSLADLTSVALRQWRFELRHGQLTEAQVRAGVPPAPAVDFGTRCIGLLGARRAFVHERGRQCAVFSDQDAKVAVGAGLLAPQVSPLWFGDALEASISAMQGGRVRVDLSLLHVALAKPMEATDRVRGIGDLDRPLRHEQVVRGSFALEVGAWSLLQLVPVPGTGEHFVVYLRVEEDV